MVRNKEKIKKFKIREWFKEDSFNNLYKKRKAKAIANYKVFIPGGLLAEGKFVNDTKLAEAKWNEKYPNGFVDWVKERINIDPYVLTNILDQIEEKINEIIENINKNTP